MNTRFEKRLGICLLILLAGAFCQPASVATAQSNGGIQGGINIDNPVLPGDRVLPSSRLPQSANGRNYFRRPTGLAKPRNQRKTTKPTEMVEKTVQPKKIVQPKSVPAAAKPVKTEPRVARSSKVRTPVKLINPRPQPRTPMNLRQVSIKDQLRRTAKGMPKVERLATNPKEMSYTKYKPVRSVQAAQEKAMDAAKAVAQEKMAKPELPARSTTQGTDGPSPEAMVKEKQPADPSNLEGPTAEEIEIEFQNGEPMMPENSEIIDSNSQVIGGVVPAMGPWDSYMNQYMPSLCPQPVSISCAPSCAPTVHVIETQSKGCCLCRRRTTVEYRHVDCGQVWVRRVEPCGLFGLRRRVSYFALNPLDAIHVQDCCSQNILPVTPGFMLPLLDSPIEEMEWTTTEEQEQMQIEESTEPSYDEPTMEEGSDSKMEPAGESEEVMEPKSNTPSPENSDSNLPNVEKPMKSEAARELEQLQETLRKLEAAEGNGR